MPISNDLLSSTLYSIRDKEVDELFQKVPLLEYAKKLNGVEYEDGGIKIKRPMSVTNHSTITQFATGYEPMSLAVNDTMQPAQYGWQDFGAPIVISRKEELENQGEKAVIKIVEARLRNVMGNNRRECNKQLVAGNSATLTNLLSLAGDAISGATTGFLQQGAPTAAGQTNTVGGLARSLVPDGFGLFNRSGTAAGAFGTNGIRVMQELSAQTMARAPMGEVQLVLATELGFSNYRRALFVNERYVEPNKVGNAGRLELAFGNAVVIQDVYMPLAADLDTGIANSMYFINFESIKLIIHKDADFALSPFIDVPGTTVRAAQLYAKMQLIADNLSGCAVLYNGEIY